MTEFYISRYIELSQNTFMDIHGLTLCLGKVNKWLYYHIYRLLKKKPKE